MFDNRTHAGKLLADRLQHLSDENAVVYVLPRGGVVVGAEVARKLRVPLDIVVVRKIGHPNNPEYAIGAVAEGDVLIKNTEEWSRLDADQLAGIVQNEREEIKRHREIYTGKKRISPRGKTAIIVDDGLATGFTIRVAVASVRNERPWQIIVAVPVAPAHTARELEREVDKVVVLIADETYLGAVGAYYQDFEQVTDEEVVSILKSARN